MKQSKRKYQKESFSSKMLFLLLFCFTFAANTLAQNISGTVVDDQNEALMGVSVVVKGKPAQGTATDIDGKFSIPVSDENTVLVFSYIGFKQQEVNVAGKTTITVKMLEDSQVLDEVVVVGFQSQKKVNLTGAITAVTAEVFENRPVSNIGQALQGLVPNLNIGIKNGGLNETPSFNIRGGTTMSKNSDGKWQVDNGSPLILVDGVEVSSDILNQMNPNDIEAMSVIKDASAAAIYGTKATFGVILITSKSGKFNQDGKISYSYELSYDTPTALPDIMNAREIQEASMNLTRWTLGTPSDLEQRKLDAVIKYMNDPSPENRYIMNGNSILWVGNMNPYKEIVRDWTPSSKHNVTLSGGSEKTTYYVSLGYQGKEGMYSINTDNTQRYNGTVRVNSKVKEWFNVEAKATYNRMDYAGPYIPSYKGNIWDIMKNDADKNINMPIKTLPTDPIPNTYTDNFLGWVAFGARSNSQSTTTVLSVSPEFIIIPKVLKVKADLSYTPETYKYTRRIPEHNYVTFNWGTTVSEVSETTENQARLVQSQTENYLMNVYAEFNKTFAQKHNLSAILGYSQERYQYAELAENLHQLFSPDILNPDAVEDKALNTMEASSPIRTGRSVFGRINYNFDNRYLFEVNGRQDGSSKFTPDGRFFFFPSVSAGWRISEESFMDFSKDWLSNLKVRASWGKLGSQPSRYYPYQAVMESGTAYYFINGQYVTQVGTPALVSPTLTWEKAESTNFGVEAAVLNSRLTAEFDLFRRKTTDILVEGSEAFPNTLGATPPTQNSGVIESRGWELSMKWADKFLGDVRYSIGFTLADARAQVLNFPSNPTKVLDLGSDGTARGLYNKCYVGDIWGYETGGILQAGDLVLNDAGTKYTFYGPSQQGTNYYPGDLWFKDLNGDGLITSGSSTADNPGDKRIIGNSTPRFNYSITPSISWKGFDLNLFFQGVGKRDLYIENSTFWGSTQNGAGSRWMNQRAWQPDRTDAKYPRYLGANNKTPQTGYLVDASYFRLKQAILGYSVPKNLISKLSIDNLRFSVSGYNLFEITDIPKIFDPAQVSSAYPSKRTVAFSAQITF